MARWSPVAACLDTPGRILALTLTSLGLVAALVLVPAPPTLAAPFAVTPAPVHDEEPPTSAAPGAEDPAPVQGRAGALVELDPLPLAPAPVEDRLQRSLRIALSAMVPTALLLAAVGVRQLRAARRR